MNSFSNNAYIENLVQEGCLRGFRRHIKENEHSTLSGNVLILTDRLFYLANELSLYMKRSTNVNIMGVILHNGDMELLNPENIDYLIVVGFLENEENYNIINTIRCNNPRAKTIQWSMEDNYVSYLRRKYEISFAFDRLKPVSEFMDYLDKLKTHKDCERSSYR